MDLETNSNIRTLEIYKEYADTMLDIMKQSGRFKNGYLDFDAVYRFIEITVEKAIEAIKDGENE